LQGNSVDFFRHGFSDIAAAAGANLHPGVARVASNSGMNSPQETENRLIELEIKASYTEDTLDRLNAVVVRQQQQIDSLLRELAEWKRQGPASDNLAPRSLRDELPPHY
jgi:SlyX protein